MPELMVVFQECLCWYHHGGITTASQAGLSAAAHLSGEPNSSAALVSSLLAAPQFLHLLHTVLNISQVFLPCH